MLTALIGMLKSKGTFYWTIKISKQWQDFPAMGHKSYFSLESFLSKSLYYKIHKLNIKKSIYIYECSTMGYQSNNAYYLLIIINW